MTLWHDWLTGWRTLYPPMTFRGATTRIQGELRLQRALACVDEDGRRLRPFPRAAVAADAVRHGLAREQAALHRHLLGL